MERGLKGEASRGAFQFLCSPHEQRPLPIHPGPPPQGDPYPGVGDRRDAGLADAREAILPAPEGEGEGV